MGVRFCLCALRLRGSDLAQAFHSPFPSFVRFDSFAALADILKKVPSYLSVFLLRLMSNALPSFRRLRHQMGCSRAQVRNCYYCGLGDDAISHMFDHCTVVRLAFLIYFRRCGVAAQFCRFALESFCLLNCPVTTCRERRLWVAFYLAFAFTIWDFSPRVLAYRAAVSELRSGSAFG